ncbi:hypothetical protein [Verrucosispora sp. WMMD1129]|uniref:hypothetical protein n=1 Tax=Verrucosispora sp. WMMD1129 TaxID=3016093 RepID=UPI002499B69E|nr:hypothetical protein [Verrucosispora sp. WMMD1129]WFE44147.1 hypothetical protein O7624_07255 [Verrucosispora sp. WMMD1129]
MFSRDGADLPRRARVAVLSPADLAIITDALADHLEEAVAAADHLAGADDPAGRAEGRIADGRAAAVRALMIRLGAPDDRWSWFPLAPDRLPEGMG